MSGILIRIRFANSPQHDSCPVNTGLFWFGNIRARFEFRRESVGSPCASKARGKEFERSGVRGLARDCAPWDTNRLSHAYEFSAAAAFVGAFAALHGSGIHSGVGVPG